MRSVSTLLLASLLAALGGCAPEGSSAYVSSNQLLQADCMPGDGIITTGKWDIGAGKSKDTCQHSYFMTLLVNSNLKANANDSTGRAEPDVLLITHADILIMDKGQAALPFNKKDGTPDPAYPNPYRVQTSSSIEPTTSTTATQQTVPIEAIPKIYADKLANYAGDSIMLEVSLFGTTTGDVDVDFRPFLYPVAICAGCLSRCMNGLEAKDVSALQANKCTDNAPQDDRYCIDTGC
jgi:hypothetical protein